MTPDSTALRGDLQGCRSSYERMSLDCCVVQDDYWGTVRPGSSRPPLRGCLIQRQ